MDSNTIFTVFRVSKTEDIATSAHKYRDLRLEALRASPTSFSSTYEIETAFTEDDWARLLATSGRETFICAAIPRQDNLQQHSSSAKWVGQATLRGTLSPEPSPERSACETSLEMTDPANHDECWQMLSLFTLPEYRGQGLGKKLCQEVTGYIRGYRQTSEVAELSLIVKSDNAAAVRLYERLGFHHARRCTLVEALIANGDSHLLPADLSASKYTDLSGLVMRLAISRI